MLRWAIHYAFGSKAELLNPIPEKFYRWKWAVHLCASWVPFRNQWVTWACLCLMVWKSEALLWNTNRQRVPMRRNFFNVFQEEHSVHHTITWEQYNNNAHHVSFRGAHIRPQRYTQDGMIHWCDVCQRWSLRTYWKRRWSWNQKKTRKVYERESITPLNEAALTLVFISTVEIRYLTLPL